MIKKAWCPLSSQSYTVYPKKYAHGFVVLCFVVVMQSFIMNSHEVVIHIHQGCFTGTGAIVRLPQCQWSKPDGYGKISQCITTTKHSKAKTVCIFLGIYCRERLKHKTCDHIAPCWKSSQQKQLYIHIVNALYALNLSFTKHKLQIIIGNKTVVDILWPRAHPGV